MILKSIFAVFARKNVVLLLPNNVVKMSTDVLQNRVVPSAETKILKVCIIGMPNAGKSTFINNLMDRKVCATSSKVHTTKKKSLAIFTETESQILFVDTPGIVSMEEQKKFNLEKSFLRDYRSGILEADIIGVVHDISNIYTREKLDRKIIRLLESHKRKPSFLVLNKVDVLRTKRRLLDLTRSLTEGCLDGQPFPGGEKKKSDNDIKGWPNFKEIFMVSSLKGTGLEDVRQYLRRTAQPGPWLFADDTFSDELPEKIIENAVRAKLLDFLAQELPYVLKVHIEYFKEDSDGTIRTVILINCPTERISKLIAGAGDGKIRQITESVQHDLQNTFNTYVKIQLILTHKPEELKR